MLYQISRSTDIGPPEFRSAETVIQGLNPYHAFEQFRLVAGIPQAHGEDIGTNKTPCTRFIINAGSQQIRFYLTPFTPKD